MHTYLFSNPENPDHYVAVIANDISEIPYMLRDIIRSLEIANSDPEMDALLSQEEE